MFFEEKSYIINQKSEVEFEVHKFLYGKVTATYKIDTSRKGRKCSCIGGIYHGHCKHVDWITLLKNKKKLPSNVETSKRVSKRSLKELVKV